MKHHHAIRPYRHYSGAQEPCNLWRALQSSKLDAPRWQTDSSQAKHQPVASSMSPHGLSVLVPTETEGFRRSAPAPRCVVSSRDQVRTTEHIIREIALICGKRHRARRKQVRMMSLHVGCAACQLKENIGETEVSALTSTPGSLIRTINAPCWRLHTC
ncbi:hypothetical protein TcCL_NonESM09906 [Trypanosoma cruzi]|nr:hypothetical protein TcCL_NonESM09906 [Trypanosoma cruzi]